MKILYESNTHYTKQLGDIMILDINWGWGNVCWVIDICCIDNVIYGKEKKQREKEKLNFIRDIFH